MTVPPPPDLPEPARSRTPLLVALGALAVVILIAVAVVLVGGDEPGAITIAESSAASTTTADDAGSDADLVTVDGDALPEMGDNGDDPAIGEMIPTISGTGLDGAPVTIEPGDPLLIVVMAHWCPHCQAEIPRIVGWNDDGVIPDGVRVVGVSTAVDEAKGNYPPSTWLKKERWPFDTLADDADYGALSALGVNSFPTLIAVGADGRVAMRASGEVERDEFEALVTAALDGAPATAGRTTTTARTGSTACPAADGSAATTRTFDGPPPVCIDDSHTYTANVTTSMGAFSIELDPSAAPATVNNFVVLARYHFYDGISFHRIIPGFVIQGGDPAGDGTGGPGYEFGDELPDAGQYELYSVAMANAGPDTNGSQFFVITGPDGVGLSPDYTLFGKVTDGTDVVDAIQSVPTDGNDAPVSPVVITRVEIVEGS